MKYHIRTSIIGKTDVGRVRTNNEDAFVAQQLWDENTFLAIAIDGVGGYEGGEIAADIAKKTIPEFLLASSNGERVELLKQAVTAANNAIFEAREADPEHGQMSCVLTAAIIDVAQKQISMAHVGDSRLYSFHQGELKKLSHDHSLIGYREEIGDLSEEEAMHHPQRNVIGRDVGSQKHKANDDDFIEAEVFPLLPNTTLLLCSDGLTDMITSSAISVILSQKGNLEEKATALIKAALDAGGKDNVTVVLFEYQSDEPEAIPEKVVNEGKQMNTIKEKQNEANHQLTEKTLKRNWLKIVLSIIGGILIGIGVAYFYLNGKMEENKAGFETKEKGYLDTISSLNSKIEQLESQSPIPVDDSIDILKTENADLKRKFESVYNERNQLKKECKKLKNELNALRSFLK